MTTALDPSKTVAILIGMTEFVGFDPIKSASRNVEGLTKLLADKTIFGLPNERIHKIIDKTSADVKRLITQYLLDAQKVKAKTLLLYYAGHGYKRTDGQYFLTACDSDPELINLDGSASIPYEDALKKILKNARIPQIIVVLDACYSGVVAQSGDNLVPDLDLKASYTLTSSSATETSLFDVNQDFTYFTATLIGLLYDGVSNSKEMLTLADLYEALRSNMRKKNLKMSPQQSLGKELQPHLYTFCKNKAFDPILERIQEIEIEIEKTAEEIKRGAVKNSEVYLHKLKEDVEKGILSTSEIGHGLLSQIENLLAFCGWYLKHEKTFLNEIFQCLIKSSLEAKDTELANLRQIFKQKEKELLGQNQNALNNTKDLKISQEKEISQLNKKLEDSIQKQSELEALLYVKQEEIDSQLKEKAKQSFLVSKSFIDNNIKHLSLLVSRVLKGQKRLDLILDEGDIEKLEQLMTFKILVIGELSVGKSTFINAFIGEEILPTNASPTTAIICKIKYGETKKARLHFSDHSKEPINIKIDKLSDYISIKNDIEMKEGFKPPHFSHVEIWSPINFLKENRLEIIDSPPLNENLEREKITREFINEQKADLILFIMSAIRFGPAHSEIEIINMIKSLGQNDLFFLVNQFDMLRSRQQDEVKSKAINVLPKLNERENGIYFVNALDALEGHIMNNPELKQKSGFSDFETGLRQFLYQEKGIIKILRSARELRRIINKTINRAIPEKIEVMKVLLQEFEERYSKLMQQSGDNHETLSQVEASIQIANINFKIAEIEDFSEILQQTEEELEEFIEAIFINKP